MIAYNDDGNLVELGGKTTSLFGTCSTAADVAAKTVTLPSLDSLRTGLSVVIKFVNSNTASNPTLQVNSTEAKPIYRYGTTRPGINPYDSWTAGSIQTFTYDGTNWVLNEQQDLSYIIPIEITKEAYDQLSPDEILDRTFFIIDYDVPGVSAVNVDYSNTTSGLSSTNVQGAIDELKEIIDEGGGGGGGISYSLTAGTGADADKIILNRSVGNPDKVTVPYASDAGTVNGQEVQNSGFINQFEGTTAEWEALTTEEKTQYDEYKITDDYIEPEDLEADSVSYDNTLSGLSATNVQSAIDELSSASPSGNSSIYGTCTTSAATAQKDVSATGVTELKTGFCLTVKFTESNTANNPTLAVNSLTAKPIYKYGSTVPGTTSFDSWEAGSMIQLTYDGAAWVMNDQINSSYFRPIEILKADYDELTPAEIQDKVFFITDYSVNENVPATQVSYSNAGTGLSATSVQGALTELDSNLSDCVTGSGVQGRIAVFDSTSSIEDGPEIGSSTVTFLRNDGTWDVPIDKRFIKVTKAEYDALGTAVLSDGNYYFITDWTPSSTASL